MTFSEDYWSLYNGESVNFNTSWSYVNHTDGTIRDDIDGSGTQVRALRPMISLQPSFIDQIVFAVSQSDNPTQSYSDITDPTIGSYSSLYDATSQIDGMKARIYNSSLQITFSDILNGKNQSVTNVTKGGTVKLKYSANAGNNLNGDPYTVSMLIFNQSGDFIRYQPLASASGSEQIGRAHV